LAYQNPNQLSLEGLFLNSPAPATSPCAFTTDLAPSIAAAAEWQGHPIPIEGAGQEDPGSGSESMYRPSFQTFGSDMYGGDGNGSGGAGLGFEPQHQQYYDYDYNTFNTPLNTWAHQWNHQPQSQYFEGSAVSSVQPFAPQQQQQQKQHYEGLLMMSKKSTVVSGLPNENASAVEAWATFLQSGDASRKEEHGQGCSKAQDKGNVSTPSKKMLLETWNKHREAKNF
jgi:hypothetical protein